MTQHKRRDEPNEPATAGLRVLHIALVAATALLVSACGDASEAASTATSPAPTTTSRGILEAAWSRCSTPGVLTDGATTLILDTIGDEDVTGDQYERVSCVLDVLDMPASVESHINSTRALDGMQTDTWGKVSARWTYHPDDRAQDHPHSAQLISTNNSRTE